MTGRRSVPSGARRERARAQLAVAAAALARKSNANLLDALAWPRELEERFFADGAERLPRPEYAVDRAALEDDNAALDEASRAIEGDEPIPTWLRATIGSAVDRNRLVLAAGTAEFGRLAQAIYGGAGTKFFGLPVTNSDLAAHVLRRLRVHGWDEAADEAAVPLSDRAFAAELEARIERHRPAIEVAVVVDPRATAKAIAGATRVRVRAGAEFLPWEADGLFAHEVETHAFTAQNGALQEYAPFLRAGGPRSTPTQEGLAVFGELYERALAVPRLERLARRVEIVHMAEDGASFLDVYRALLARGAPPRDAYLDATRVFRGGLVEGGAAFTKDASYLAGLLHVYAFLSAFVRGGFRDEVEMLFAGRIALEDVPALVELRALGLLARPRHRPRWLDRWETLLPYFAFTSFMDAFALEHLEAHYRAAIDVAAAARPR